jgi:probable rRNA maturation factor
MLRASKLPKAELSILLCDDGTIHELNRDFRKKDKPTDVLAFAMREGEHADPTSNVLGDVVVSIDTARRQAAERGRSVKSEVTFLLAHGLLHLLGYDHRTDAEEREMNALTERLCALAAVETPARGTARKPGKPVENQRISRSTSARRVKPKRAVKSK